MPNDRNSTDRVEFGADGESDTQTVPSMDGESGASAASGDDPGEMWRLMPTLAKQIWPTLAKSDFGGRH